MMEQKMRTGPGGRLLNRSLVLALSSGISCLSPSPSSAQSRDVFLGSARFIMNEPSYLEFGAGAFDVTGHGRARVSGAGSIEYHYGRKLFWLGPTLGLLADHRGALLGYGGFYSDIKIAPFVITPMAGFGFYRRGGGLDLGGPFAFRLSLAAAYQRDNFSLLGIKFSHVSNVGIYGRAPSDNELLLTYTMPIPQPF
jgi:lipid A 3-O-deacylase